MSVYSFPAVGYYRAFVISEVTMTLTRVRLIAFLVAGQLCLGEALAQTNTAASPTVSIQALSNAAGTVPRREPLPSRGLVRSTRPWTWTIRLEARPATPWITSVSAGRVTIPAGQASAQITVIPFDDGIQEPPETVVLTLVPRNSPFRIVLLPDTQYYTSSATSGGLPEMFTAQTRWIADYKDDQNIAFVLHEGDVTDQNTLTEWQRGQASMGWLDGVVPYAIAPGNHDGLMTSASQTSLFNQFYRVASYLGRLGLRRGV